MSAVPPVSALSVSADFPVDAPFGSSAGIGFGTGLGFVGLCHWTQIHVNAVTVVTGVTATAAVQAVCY